jgi:hypothetical protein
MYLIEKVQALLKMAVWYVRLKNESQVEKVFNNAVALVEEEERYREDPALNGVLEEYAGTFRRLGRAREADRLAELAQGVREKRPDVFSRDGSEIPWWKRPDFLQSLPALPVEFRASHGEWPSGAAWVGACVATFMVGGILMATVLRPVYHWLGEGVFAIFFFGAVILSGVLAERWRGRLVYRHRTESWCRLTEDGIEFHDPKGHCQLRWSDIQKVWNVFDSGQGDDTTFDVVEVVGGGGRFRMSGRFFTEQEVKWVEGICRLKSGIE